MPGDISPCSTFYDVRFQVYNLKNEDFDKLKGYNKTTPPDFESKDDTPLYWGTLETLALNGFARVVRFRNAYREKGDGDYDPTVVEANTIEWVKEGHFYNGAITGFGRMMHAQDVNDNIVKVGFFDGKFAADTNIGNQYLHGKGIIFKNSFEIVSQGLFDGTQDTPTKGSESILDFTTNELPK